MKEALLIIDVQNDYFPNGNCELFKANEALEVIKKLIQKFREQKKRIIYIQHISEEKATFFNKGTCGVEIHSSIAPKEEDVVLVKHRPNSFYNTGLYELLQKEEITDLCICGMMSHMCVDTTVRAASDLNFNITVCYDACTTKSLNWQEQEIPAAVVHQTYMTSLDGTFATVVSSDKILGE